jgi:hypothetical protein
LIGKAAVGAAAVVALGAARTGAAAARALQPATNDPADKNDGQNAPAGEEVRGLDEKAPPPAEPVAISSPPLWELVSPLAAGSVLAHGWQLVELSPVQHGSCVATLQNARGRSHRVHLCRNDGTPQGIVYTRRVDLVVMNEGHGDLPTEERLAQAVAELAHAVAANETKASNRIFADLLPHSERMQRFAAADGPAAYGKLR